MPEIDNYPILNQQEAAKIFSATFQKDCGSDDVCQSELIVEAAMDLPQVAKDRVWALSLGTSDDIPINVTVRNNKESAYETQLFVTHPPSVSYNRIDTSVSFKKILRYSIELINVFFAVESGFLSKLQQNTSVLQCGEPFKNKPRSLVSNKIRLEAIRRFGNSVKF